MGKTHGKKVTVYDVEVPERDELKFVVLFSNGQRMVYARSLIRDGRISFEVVDERKTITVGEGRLPDRVTDECEVTYVEDAAGQGC